MERFTGPPDVADGVNRSDIDCLLVALRHVLQQLPFDCPKSSWVIRLASKQYENDTDARRRKDTRAKLDGAGLPDNGIFLNEPQFIRTSECNLMQTTVWSLPFAQFWQPAVYTRDKTEDADWVKLAEKNEIFTREDATVKALISYQPAGTHADVRDLSAMATGCHGIFELPNCDLKLISAGPACIRMRFFPDGKRSFEDMCRFKLTTDGYRGYDYRICAAVRIRSTDAGHDLVRLYDSEQRLIPVVPAGSKEAKASYTDNDWQIGQPGHEYVLYYVMVQIVDYPRPPPKDPEEEEQKAACEKLSQGALAPVAGPVPTQSTMAPPPRRLSSESLRRSSSYQGSDSQGSNKRRRIEREDRSESLRRSSGSERYSSSSRR
ncbi:hypothetical protein B0T11DRAFT_298922 [Plectosphaerella cucumerina]|uniref:Uncharacterized protein n=1 Tax=Plectosphaerella cucumerina TaxID=40658 RepID=A0A8K0TB25_9PEZI|nr:hypothetical protein B0T11DRAFT_298922 [Plectosphaerella cucumerina]